MRYLLWSAAALFLHAPAGAQENGASSEAVAEQTGASQPVSTDRAQIIKVFGEGRYNEALELSSQRVDRLRGGGQDTEFAGALADQGAILSTLGRDKDAIPVLREAVSTVRRAVGVDSPSGLEAQASLAIAYLAIDDPKRALVILDDLVPRRRRLLGKNSVDWQVYDAALLMAILDRADAKIRSKQVEAALGDIKAVFVDANIALESNTERAEFLERAAGLFESAGQMSWLGTQQLPFKTNRINDAFWSLAADETALIPVNRLIRRHARKLPHVHVLQSICLMAGEPAVSSANRGDSGTAALGH